MKGLLNLPVSSEFILNMMKSIGYNSHASRHSQIQGRLWFQVKCLNINIMNEEKVALQQNEDNYIECLILIS